MGPCGQLPIVGIILGFLLRGGQVVGGLLSLDVRYGFHLAETTRVQSIDTFEFHDLMKTS